MEYCQKNFNHITISLVQGGIYFTSPFPNSCKYQNSPPPPLKTIIWLIIIIIMIYFVTTLVFLVPAPHRGRVLKITKHITQLSA